MTLTEAIQARHSVRRYKPDPIETELVDALQEEIDQINQESGLHIQLITNEPKAFDTKFAHYGRFEGVANYFAMVGPKGADLNERCGYYGERLVLKAQQLGLHTCWVGLHYKKIPEVFTIGKGEKLALVITVGHGKSRGVKRKSKSPQQVSNLTDASPDWFKQGVEAALLAPTAVNQQQFYFTMHEDGTVSAKSKLGPFANMDLGIVKYHFEIGAGKDNFDWRNSK